MTGGHARTPFPGTVDGTRFRVEVVDETGSTNADLAAAAARGEPEGLVLMADHQTAGRGRRDRTWEAPPGSSLLVSILLRPGLAPSELSGLTAAVGLSARAACVQVAGVEPALKWPNDLLAETGAGERKLGGILAESVVEGDRVAAVVVGLGLNVSWPDDLPPELAEIAVALNHLGAGDVDRATLLTRLLVDLEDRVQALEADPTGWCAATWRDWAEVAATPGRSVVVETAGGSIRGTAEGVTDQGRLRVDTGTGTVVVDAGDVLHLR